MNRILIIILFSFFGLQSMAQYMTAAEYVQKYKDLAIEEMKRMGVPAAITLAQGLLETENGNSDLLKESNNHFGIKCKSTWTSEVVYHDDDARGECFRKYKTAEDSYRDHSNFLRGNTRYAFLFKLDPSDYKAWAYGLKRAGYATNPRYPQILIKYIEDNNLEQYTDEALGEVPQFDDAKYVDDTENQEQSDVASIDPVPDHPVDMTINGSKALWVAKGTSLLAIATEHNINLEKLLAMNDMDNDGLLQKDQYIFLEKKHKEGSQDVCVVQPKETLYDISQKYGVILQNLYEYNNLTADDYLVAGTKILLRPNVQLNQVASASDKATVIPVKNNESTHAAADRISHFVHHGETLYGISKKYGVTVEELKKWNHLRSNNLQPGQRLIILK
ncbi:MAG: glucosaminidase domain-containing protein [Ginsengibacter sp.]